MKYEGGDKVKDDASNDSDVFRKMNTVEHFHHSCSQSECSLEDDLKEAENLISLVKEFDQDTRIFGKDHL